VPYANGRFDGRAAVNPQARSLRFEAVDAAGNASEVRFVTIVRTGGAKGQFPGLSPHAGAPGGLPEFTLDKDPSVVLVLVPAGDVVLGPAKDDPSAKVDEGKSRKVKVQAFLVAKTEVTWDQWEKFRAATKRAGPMLPGDEPRANPAHGLSFSDAKAWCDWAGLRLPTENEWERAARGGVEGALFWWGSDVPPKKRVGNLSDEVRKSKTKADLGGEYWFRYDDGFAGLAPVASFAPNGFGLYDVTGNVWEWCSDPYNPREPSGKRVLRGGAFDSRRSDCRVSRRNPQDPDFASDSTGFRPAGG
jgi:formylglycine-generating enzyme required for sulfatase activity